MAWLVLLVTLAGTAQAAGPASSAAGAGLTLGREIDSVDAWPAVRILPDVTETLDYASAWAQREQFQAPSGPHANLGPRQGATWLIVPVQVATGAPGTWMLKLDYALMHEVHVHVLDAHGRLIHDDRLGTRVPFEQRRQKTRALTSELSLQPGQRYEVLLRVTTPTGVLMPISFMQHSALGVDESRAQALQGTLTGLWGFMVVYSLVHGALRRQVIFFAYTGSLVSSWLFAQAIYGIGPVFLWPGSAWLATHMSALAPMLMLTANAIFLAGTLEARRVSPRIARAWYGIAIAALCTAMAFASGLLSYRPAAVTGMLVGVVHLALVVPVALRRLREGDRVAGFVLAGAMCNMLGILVLSLLLRGFLPVGFLSLHAVQFGYLAEMVLWMVVLGVRLEQMRRAADAARQEHERLQVQARTDALTGLNNRRGLESWLMAACEPRPHAPGGSPPALALFMIDLDGFKPVNDRWGHEVGDALLREVARRLVGTVRSGDAVARLGGDEFVIGCPGVADAAPAEVIGRKLLAAFERPFDLGDGRVAGVGATIGYALASEHGADTGTLLRQADAAMYAGKRAGRRRVVRQARDETVPA